MGCTCHYNTPTSSESRRCSHCRNSFKPVKKQVLTTKQKIKQLKKNLANYELFESEAQLELELHQEMIKKTKQKIKKLRKTK